jgi:pyruvate/2-oxoglutarate dehydrogenase complex dihydrolipoamide acyltransferase (E2) component
VTAGVAWNGHLDRPLREEPPEALGRPTWTLAVEAMRTGDAESATALAGYAAFELTKANTAVGRYAEEIVAFGGGARSAVTSLTTFDPAGALVARAEAAARRGDVAAFERLLDELRSRLVGHHDALVWWVAGLLDDLATRLGPGAVVTATDVADEELWKPAFAGWDRLPSETRLHLTAETVRGHAGAVTVRDDGDRWTLTLDPCGACGVLRRGDPATGRAPDTRGPGFYALHVALHRDTHGCDEVGPCTWTVPKHPPSEGALMTKRPGVLYRTDVDAPTTPPPTPAVRRRADELGVDPAGVRGTGLGGRVRLRDLAPRESPDGAGPAPLQEPRPVGRREMAARALMVAEIDVTGLVDDPAEALARATAVAVVAHLDRPVALSVTVRTGSGLVTEPVLDGVLRATTDALEVVVHDAGADGLDLEVPDLDDEPDLLVCLGNANRRVVPSAGSSGLAFGIRSVARVALSARAGVLPRPVLVALLTELRARLTGRST